MAARLEKLIHSSISENACRMVSGERNSSDSNTLSHDILNKTSRCTISNDARLLNGEHDRVSSDIACLTYCIQCNTKVFNTVALSKLHDIFKCYNISTNTCILHYWYCQCIIVLWFHIIDRL